MLFVNISQAPFIISMIGLLILLIAFTLFRQYKLKNLFFSKEQLSALSQNTIKSISYAKTVSLIIITIMLGISLLDPRGSSLSSELELEGMDIVLVYDISRSMDVQDVSPSRLGLAKNLGEQLIDTLAGNRIGLVAYAADALRLLPLTTDSSSVELFVNDLSTDMIGSQSTDIGKALDEAVKNFKEDTLTHKAIILFTDGENLDGTVNMDMIKQQGISLFIIGVGTEEGGTVPVLERNGQTNTLKTVLGQDIISKIDSKYLQNLADQVGGEFVHGSRASINKISTLIENIEKSPFGTNTQSFLEPKFRMFILIALFALMLYLFLPNKKWYKKLSLLLLFLSFVSTNYSLTTDRKAYSSYQDGEYSTALRFFQRSLVKDPSNLKAKFGEGSTLYKLERSDRAEKSFLALTNNDNSQIAQQSIYNAANAKVQRKAYDEALTLYKEVMRDNPIDSRLYKKAFNNYLYTRALQQQQQNQQNEENQEGQQDQQNEQNQDQEGQQDQQNGESQKQNQQEQEQNAPSQSISPSDIDNLLGIAQESEKANFSKQFKGKTGLLQQNKY